MKTKLIYIITILLIISCNNTPKNENKAITDTSLSKKKQSITDGDKVKTGKELGNKTEKKIIKSNRNNKTMKKGINKPKPNKKPDNKNLNKTIVKHDEYIEIYEKLIGKDGEITGKKHKVDLINYPFLSLSAYIQPKKSNVLLHYKYYDGEKWSNWQLLPEDKHIFNKKRTVFGLINIKDNIKEIQFKSNTQIDNIVFNIFTPKN